MFKKAKKQEKAERNRQKKAAGEVNPPAELADEALEQAAGGWRPQPPQPSLPQPPQPPLHPLE